MKKYLLILLACAGLDVQAQVDSTSNSYADSVYISETEKPHPLKVLHAEPLFIDLIRDLGARKGEKEWNLGFGIADNNRYDNYTALVEYEWAPVDRIGLEVELPFTFYAPIAGVSNDSLPANRLNSLKLAAQYTFLVSDVANTSLALGYIHEFEMPGFREFKQSGVWKGNVFNPFFVAAKRWGNNVHSLVYTGPLIEKHKSSLSHIRYQVNTNFHYMLPGTRNFVGLEMNKEWHKKDFDMTIRPQMRLSLADNLLVGIVTGIPIRRETERFSSFVRLIYEPGHRKHHYRPGPVVLPS